MSFPKLCAAALLLLSACSKPAPERAQAAALLMLQHQLPAAAHLRPESLTVYEFSRAQLRYFSSDVPTFGDGHLVTYEASAAGTPRKQAVFVADNDSAFFFLPLRHEREFARRFGVQVPAAAQ